MDKNTSTIFISKVGLSGSDEDKIVLLTLADSIKGQEYHFALPMSVVGVLSYGLNKACEDLQIDNSNIND